MKKINLILGKCKSLSMQLGRSSSYNSLRSRSAREDRRRRRVWDHIRRGGGKNNVENDDGGDDEHQECETIYVGSTRKQYVLSSKYLKHPLLNALIEKHGRDDHMVVVKCEVVLFDHLLWLLENSDPNLILDSLEELTDLYVF
ncbi:auxin-responsive protein SAUR78-like [Hibiscus syriacus]|uniref:auxin-responsive protein SAUR78-like n=1 Tax=Hibiscus syriacus TaxID=106335 RepID=UPI001920E309|nr:auxin-responsive protein SAUR78-like [Hibiscus syriacus]